RAMRGRGLPPGICPGSRRHSIWQINLAPAVRAVRDLDLRFAVRSRSCTGRSWRSRVSPAGGLWYLCGISGNLQNDYTPAGTRIQENGKITHIRYDESLRITMKSEKRRRIGHEEKSSPPCFRQYVCKPGRTAAERRCRAGRRKEI